MTALTQCYAAGRPPLLLRPSLVFRVGFILFFVALLGMGLTYLRFVTRDLKIESSKLQKTQMILLSQKNTLASEVERYKRFENLREAESVKLGFAKCPPERSFAIVVSDSAVQKWKDVATRYYEEGEGSRTEPTERLLATVGERVLTWSSVSMAREPLDGDK